MDVQSVIDLAHMETERGGGYWRNAMTTLRAISGDIGAPPVCSSRMESSRRPGSVSLSR
jgi:hypothetical protein